MSKHTERLLGGSVYDEQVKLEYESINQGVERYRRLVKECTERGEGASLKPAERLLLHWLEPMTKAIRAEHRAIKRGEAGKGRHLCGELLLKVAPVKLAVITLHEMMGQCMAYPRVGPTMLKLAMGVGRSVMAEINMQDLKALDRKAGKDEPKPWWGFSRKVTTINPNNINHFAAKVLGDQARIERRSGITLGMNLIWHAIGCCSISKPDEPFRCAFKHYRKVVSKRGAAFLRFDHDIFEVIEYGHEAREHLRPQFSAMITKPLAWEKFRDGGYVKLRQPIIKRITPEHRIALEGADLSRVFDALNHLQSTAWKINNSVRGVIVALWEAGGDCAGLPSREPSELPERPEGIDDDPEILKAWKKAATEVHKEEAKRMALALEVEFYQLPTAQRYARYDRFYFPHNLDFRGRVYPIPLYLNHYGGDICRGMLEFADGEPVEEGFEWLQVHAANCWGYDKVSFKDRIDWVKDAWENIVQASNAPLENRWWMEADKPFQFLAACFALVRVANDPTALCHLPVQMDGSNNALQQMAALGRDAIGAEACNLIPSDEPQDLYGRVADATAKIVEADDHELSAEVLPYINRKTVKQTVMTKSYAVTRLGAKAQIGKRLEEMDFPKETRKQAATYIRDKLFDALAGTLVAATELMDWLAACVICITKAGHATQWVTPLGLPVVQPYRKPHHDRIRTAVQWVSFESHNVNGKPLLKKQVQGITANYVHGIDATHCLMVAREMSREGIAFSSVHDSFWVLPSRVERMRTVTTEQFAVLHRQPLILELFEQWKKLYPEVELPPPPPAGDYNIEQVLESRYFFA